MRQRSGSARAQDSDSGAVALIVAICLTALLGVAALAVDVGAMYAERRQMQTAADAAVLAGVLELPGDPSGAVAVATDYAQRNTDRASQMTFEIRQTNAPNDTIVAVLRDPAMGLFFARALGTSTVEVDAGATAIVGSPQTWGSGLMPFGIVANGTTTSPYGYVPGGVLPLVVDTGDQSQGNWHYVDLTPFTDGANQTKAVIAAGGTTDPVSIGQVIDTQPGSPNNPNFKALTKYLTDTCSPHGLEALVYNEDRGVYEPTHLADGTHCNRLITCPVIAISTGDPYDWDGTAGKSVSVTVVGFLNMLVSNDPTAKDGALMATFVQVVPANPMAPGPYIPYGGVVTWLDR